MSSISLFDNSHSFTLPLEHGEVVYIPNWLTHKHAKHLMDYFIERLAWEQPSISLYGKLHKIPRLQAWYGDPDTQYEYSKFKMDPLSWEPRLLKLKHACEQASNAKFNSVLANYYRNGQDSMGMHADDEKELGDQPTIASVSLGQQRRIVFKHRISNESHKLLLEHGSLLIMSGDTQKHYLHGINKSKTQVGPRLNFTFRWVYQS